jgi:hypothetical protein
MISTRVALLSLLALPAALAVPPAACCVYGGTGAATMTANAVMTLPGRPAAVLTVALGAGTAEGGDSFVAVIVGSDNGPEASVAGWTIRENETSQTITVWSQAADGGGAPTCSRGTVDPAKGYLPSLKICFGEGSAYPDLLSSFMVGGVLPASWWGINGTTGALFSVTDVGCAPVSLTAHGTPFGTGAFSLDVQGGGPDAAPAAWAEAPSACGF